MKNLKYVSWADNTGYAVAAKTYVRALDERGVSILWEPMLPTPKGYVVAAASAVESDLAPLVQRDIDYSLVLIHTVPEYFPAVIDREKTRDSDTKIYGYTVWELETLPDHWPLILNRLDGVVVPCHWNKEVFKRSGVTVPIHVVAHLDQFEGDALTCQGSTNVRLPLLDQSPATDPDRFVFYTIGHWSNRKAPERVVRAFLDAFNDSSAVSLVVKTSRNDVTRWSRLWRNGFRKRHPSPRQAVTRLIADYPNPPPISIIDDESLTKLQMRALHARGDCFVSLARSEGWGLGAFEAASLGNPVIMTNYGGQRDFLDAELAYLIDYTLVPVHEPIWKENYRTTDRWAEPSLAQAVATMRSIYAEPEAASKRARCLADRITSRFSREKVTDALVAALS